MGFSRQEHWGGLPCPPPGDLSDPGIKPASPALAACPLPLCRLGDPSDPTSFRFTSFIAHPSVGFVRSRLDAERAGRCTDAQSRQGGNTAHRWPSGGPGPQLPRELLQGSKALQLFCLRRKLQRGVSPQTSDFKLPLKPCFIIFFPAYISMCLFSKSCFIKQCFYLLAFTWGGQGDSRENDSCPEHRSCPTWPRPGRPPGTACVTCVRKRACVTYVRNVRAPALLAPCLPPDTGVGVVFAPKVPV